jgi:hypothetical protein
VAKSLSEPLLRVVHELSQRQLNNELEQSGKGSTQLRKWQKEALDPAMWPPAPGVCPRPFRWARAKFL